MEFSALASIYYKENPLFFRQAMESVWEKQSVKPTEMVLVKDGTLTVELDKEILFWKDKLGDKLNIVTLEKNLGTGKAKKIGIDNCKYDYIAVVDTDDICMPNRFEIQTKFLKENPQVDIVGSWLKEFDAKTEEIYGARVLPEKHDDIVKFMKRRSGISHPTSMYKKEVILKAGNYKHLLLYEDYYLWVRCIQNGAILANIKEYLLLFRSGEEMIKRRGGIKYLKTELKFQKWLYRCNFINLMQFILNCTKRIIVRLVGKQFRYYMYRRLLRQKIKE